MLSNDNRMHHAMHTRTRVALETRQTNLLHLERPPLPVLVHKSLDSPDALAHLIPHLLVTRIGASAVFRQLPCANWMTLWKNS